MAKIPYGHENFPSQALAKWTRSVIFGMKMLYHLATLPASFKFVGRNISSKPFVFSASLIYLCTLLLKALKPIHRLPEYKHTYIHVYIYKYIHIYVRVSRFGSSMLNSNPRHHEMNGGTEKVRLHLHRYVHT
jgi:hypothetical protein